MPEILCLLNVLRTRLEHAPSTMSLPSVAALGRACSTYICYAYKYCCFLCIIAFGTLSQLYSLPTTLAFAAISCKLSDTTSIVPLLPFDCLCIVAGPIVITDSARSYFPVGFPLPQSSQSVVPRQHSNHVTLQPTPASTQKVSSKS